MTDADRPPWIDPIWHAWDAKYGERVSYCKKLLGDRYLTAVPRNRVSVVAHTYERVPESLLISTDE